MSELPPPPEIPPPPPYASDGPHGAFAGFWIRFLAAVLDALVIGVPMAILGMLTGGTDSTSVDSFGNRSHSTSFRIGYGFTPGVELWFNLLNLVVGVAYFASLEGGATGQTLGKRICSLRVVDAVTGQPGIGAGRAIGRYFARWLSAIPLLLGYLWMLWDPKKQCWHDKLVNDVVVTT
jgi:uncharacterized RDD family membrane protein YckC